MTVTVYKSTDASAPTLSGTVGSLIALLDAILVNGYGAKASQGWTKPYTGTNQATYKMGAGNARYLSVIDDGATTAGAANYARVHGWEACTAQNTGTNSFPSAAQFSGGLYVHKSNTADATVRPWFAYCNGTFIHLFVDLTSLGTGGAVLGAMMFGDFPSFVASDTYNTLMIAGTAAAVAINAAQNMTLVIPAAFNSLAMLGHYVCRALSGVGTSAVLSKFTPATAMMGMNNGSTYGIPIGSYLSTTGTGTATALLGYPNVADAGLYAERMFLVDSSSIRGELPGCLAPCHHLPLNHLDTFSGGASGALSGRSYEVLKFLATSASGEIFMETSSTW